MDMSMVFDRMEKIMAERITFAHDDYLVDGLLYCGKCKTPKQCRVEVLGEVRTPYCLCQCEADKVIAEEEEQKKQEHMMRIARMRKTGFPDAEMCRWTFDRDDGANERMTKVAKNYVEHFDEMKKRSKGLLLFGSVGTGKTFFSACIANALIDQGIPCLVTNFARLVNTITGMYEGKQEYIDGLDKFSLLVIDDLGAERETEYMGEVIHSIIDSRYRSGKPLIVTTNLTAEELKYPSDVRKQRVYSRLFEMCIPIEVKGLDRRKEKLKDDFAEFHQILGL